MPSRRDAVRALAIAGLILAMCVFAILIINFIIYICCINIDYIDVFIPKARVIIEEATLTKVGDNKYDLSISVREVGGASTTIQKIVLVGGGLDSEKQCYLKSGQNATLYAGQSKQLTYQCDLQLPLGVTYYVRVYYQKGEGSEATDLYPVTVR